jgi:hypothetical protein
LFIWQATDKQKANLQQKRFPQLPTAAEKRIILKCKKYYYLLRKGIL